MTTAVGSRQRLERSARRSRLALGSAALVVLSLAAHAAASGSLPGAGGMALVVLASVAVAQGAAQRQRSVPVLAAWLAAAQVLLHVLLTVAGGHGEHASWLPGGTMLAGHAAAAVAAAVVLVHADGIVATWRRLARVLLGVPTDADVFAPVARLAGPAAQRGPRVISRLVHHVSRRGPPLGLVALTSSG